MTERNKKGESSKRPISEEQQLSTSSEEESMHSRDNNTIKDAHNLDRIVGDHSPSLKDYYDALDQLGSGEVSFSSLPDFIVDSLIKADDETFEEFLNVRKLSKESESNIKRDKTMNHSTERRYTDDSKNSPEDTINDNPLGIDGSSNPPPLVLPPVGAVKYDDSFIEMVIKIVNRVRDNNTNHDDNIKSNEKRKEKEHPYEKDDSLPKIEKVRREKASATEDSLLLNHYSLKEEELLFLTDDKVPSFVYNDDIEQNAGDCSKLQQETKRGETSDNIAQLLSCETDDPRSNASLIPFDDELDQSCDSIDAIHLDDINEAKDEEPIFKEDNIKEEDSTDFLKDYSSWLCYDNGLDYVTFKENCGQSSESERETVREKKRVASEQVCNTQKQGSSDTKDQSKSATSPISPLNVLQEAIAYSLKETERSSNQLQDAQKRTPLIDVDSSNPTVSNIDKKEESLELNNMNNESPSALVLKHEKLKKEIKEINRKKEEEKAKRYTHATTNEEIGIKGSDIGSSSSFNSLNIESYIIATSTPRRNDSQHTNNNSSELFKTTPAKRRSPDDDSKSDGNNSSPEMTYSSSRNDYRSSPVRRRLIEAHVKDKNRNTTPSPPLAFPQNESKSNSQD